MRSLGPEEVMPCWYYDKKELRTNTPSVRDGIEPDVENRYRKEGARFIMNTGAKMGLKHYETLATGIVYFHRFYMLHSFKQFPRFVTACCCLFLAGKVEETPKKCKDIIKAARALLTDQQFSQFGEDPKEEVMTLERILLQSIKFDLQVEHPYKFLLKYCKSLKGDREKLEAMLQMAWTFVNDSLFTTLSLQWEPEIVAIALMYLAGKLSKFEVTDWHSRHPRHQRWWDMFVEDISMELLEDVCHQVLDLYSNSSNPNDSPPPTPPPPPAALVTSSQSKVPPSDGQVHASSGQASQPHQAAARKHKLPSPSVPSKPLPLSEASKSLDHQQAAQQQQPIATVASHGHPQAIQALGEAVPTHSQPPVVPSQPLPSAYKYSNPPSIPMDTYNPPSQYRISSVNSGYGHAVYPPDSTDSGSANQYSQQPPPITPTSVQPTSYMQGYEVPGYSTAYNPPLMPTMQAPPPPPFPGSYIGDPHYGTSIHPPPMHQGQYQQPGMPQAQYQQPPPPMFQPPAHMGQTHYSVSPAGYALDGSQGQIHSQNIAAIRITERQGSRQNWGV